LKHIICHQGFMATTALIFIVTLPWLNPFSFGPSPAVVALLFSWVCAAALMTSWLVVPGRLMRDQLARAAASAWLLAALLSSLMGLLQYFGETAIFGMWVNSTSMGEAYANLRQRNQFATLTNIGLAALLWWLAQGKSLWPARPPVCRASQHQNRSAAMGLGRGGGTFGHGQRRLVVPYRAAATGSC
jgi:hypothetical protein